jgi:transketolase
MSEDVGKRYEAYGWHVQNLGEDMSPERIEHALAQARAVEDRPSLIIVRSHIAIGAPHKQDTAGAHGSPLGDEEIRLTKEGYGWPSQEPFFVPDEALAHFRESVARGDEYVKEWNERFEAYRAEHPDLAAEFERIVVDRRPPAGWDADAPTKGPDAGMIATRKASQDVIQWVAAKVPELVGGSADLAPSTLTLIDDGGSVEKGSYAGRNLHFGIREFGMGTIVNGLVLSGFRAFGAGFLIFSDYMKASLRLAALMRIPSTFVFTHDSIGLGEDGPTHQPIEQLATLRATPNINVVRPAGFNETALAWRFAVNATDTPTVLALSRQGVPVWDPSAIPADAIERGAYVLSGADDPELILMGTGTEVHVAHDAAKLLEAEGIRVRLVSMPCLDRFAAQDQAYRDSVLPPAVRARVAVEAASPLGWHRWVGEAGDIVAMEGFGASAPAKALYEHFGFTGEKVAERARRVLANARA